MAEKVDNQTINEMPLEAKENVAQKPSGEAQPGTAPVEDKTAAGTQTIPEPKESPEVPAGGEGEGEGLNEQDVDNVLALLNEIERFNGGKGEISEIPPQLLGVTRFILDKMVALRDAFSDPLFKEVLDDMVDQREDGATPSLLVAVARNVPIDELQELADNENYADVQGSIDKRLAADAESQKSEEQLYANFDKSKKEIDKFCKERGYDENEKKALYDDIAMLRDAFADGLLTAAELERIDEMRNYKRDVESLQSQLPKENKKEVLPDKASIESAMNPPKTQKASNPRNSIEAMASNSFPGTDFTSVGKRKFVNKT